MCNTTATRSRTILSSTCLSAAAPQAQAGLNSLMSQYRHQMFATHTVIELVVVQIQVYTLHFNTKHSSCFM